MAEDNQQDGIDQNEPGESRQSDPVATGDGED